MKQRIIAGLLALAVCCGVVALAEEQPAPEEVPAEGTTQESTAPESSDGSQEPQEDPASPAGPDDASPEADAPYTPDAVGTLSFQNVERRMRDKNLNLLALQENVVSLETIDYEEMSEDLRTSLNGIARGQWALIQMGQGSSYTYHQMENAYNAVRKQFDAIQNGEMQEDNAGVIRQLKNLQDQIVMAGESLFVTISDLETQEASLQRQLTAMNRSVEELELRYELGQISALQLEQAKAGRSSLISGLNTMKMNISNLKTQMELLIGADLTGSITLSAVPEVSEAQLEKIDLAQDLETAKEKSYELYDAKQVLADAKEEYLDALSKHGINSTGYEMETARHTWQAAQHTYNATVQDYELRFRTLHAQVLDYQQILSAAKVSLAAEKSNYAAMELKAQQGNLSQNKLLDAKDQLTSAEEAVRTAKTDLFSAYNTYCWAVQHGILN